MRIINKIYKKKAMRGGKFAWKCYTARKSTVMVIHCLSKYNSCVFFFWFCGKIQLRHLRRFILLKLQWKWCNILSADDCEQTDKQVMHSDFPSESVSSQYSNLNMELFSSKPRVWPRIKGVAYNWTLHTYEGYLIWKKSLFVFVRTSSIKIVMNVNEPTWWIAS